MTTPPVQQIASFVVPAGVFVAASLVLLKVEKLLMPKPSRPSSSDNKSPAEGMKWSVAPRTNFLSGLTAKIFRDSKQMLSEFAKELRSFSIVDISVVFPTAEEVSFAANGITTAGIKASDGVLQSNIVLKTVKLSGNPIGDEGVKGAKHLARSLKVVNKALTSLDLAFNEIQGCGAFTIVQVLKANEDVAVTSLYLSSNFLTKFRQSVLADARDHVC